MLLEYGAPVCNSICSGHILECIHEIAEFAHRLVVEMIGEDGIDGTGLVDHKHVLPGTVWFGRDGVIAHREWRLQ
jgi:hypothetical protein